MKSLLTGSRVYGTPRPDSDIDMVVLVETTEEEILLRQHADTPKTNVNLGPLGTYNGVSLRYGGMNLILVKDPKVYAAWEGGTRFLKSIAPVTKEQACMVFDTMFEVATKTTVQNIVEVPF